MLLAIAQPASRYCVVPMARIERATSPLPRECSTTELHGLVLRALPRFVFAHAPDRGHRIVLERVKGIEPSS
jgi:hypothetical protein